MAEEARETRGARAEEERAMSEPWAEAARVMLGLSEEEAKAMPEPWAEAARAMPEPWAAVAKAPRGASAAEETARPAAKERRAGEGMEHPETAPV